MLIGATGRGKSSLLRTGMVPVCASASPAAHAPAVLRIPPPGPRPAVTYGLLGLADELREAVDRPTSAPGYLVERGSAAQLIEGVLSEPGGLPMHPHPLPKTWQRRRSARRTRAAPMPRSAATTTLPRAGDQWQTYGPDTAYRRVCG
ncbi:hypothetical protein [Streptomyces sp. NPDC047043]|uniref:nSTAND1 domain-containing NTPase n=1 Tax=Streptomyces sp. NPDC047043 TaxID=3154497 RepID=UPI003401415D